MKFEKTLSDVLEDERINKRRKEIYKKYESFTSRKDLFSYLSDYSLLDGRKTTYDQLRRLTSVVKWYLYRNEDYLLAYKSKNCVLIIDLMTNGVTTKSSVKEAKDDLDTHIHSIRKEDTK